MQEERPDNARFFATNWQSLRGASTVESYTKDRNFGYVRAAYNGCLMYATSYTQTMLDRVEAERPEFFEEKGVEKDELMVKLIH